MNDYGVLVAPRTVRLERVLLATRERVEQCGVAERNGLEALLLPHLRHGLGLEHEVRRTVEGRDEVDRSAAVLFVVG